MNRSDAVRRGLLSAALVLALAAAPRLFSQSTTAKPAEPAKPPEAPVRAVTEEYYGTKVSDAYRYMENLKDPEVAAWMKAQNDYTRAIVARIPHRAELFARIKQLDESAPARLGTVRRLPGEHYFYEKFPAQANVGKLYRRHGLAAEEILLVDPEKLSTAGGPPYALNYYAPSDDGKYVAYGISPGGSENAVLHVLEAATKRESSETIDRAQFGDVISWRPDERSFFYNRLQKLAPDAPPTDRYLKSRVFLHVIGTDPEKDPAVFGYEVSPDVKVDPADIPFVVTFPGSPHAIGLLAHGVQREITLYAAPLESLGKAGTPWHKLCDVGDDVTDFAAHGEDLYLLTHKEASRFKVIRTGVQKPDLARAAVVVPPGEPVLTGLAATQDALYVQELDGGIGRLLRLPFDGKGARENVRLPFDGSITLHPPDPRVSGLLIGMSSWTKAYRVYSYDSKTKQLTDTRLRPSGPYDNPTGIESEEVKARAADGTLIPLSIIHQRALKLDGSHPTLLVGYGAYGITLDPGFNVDSLAWLERGGVMAIAHVRGGGEYGEDWHKAGMKLTKPNTWRDFIACAEYLIEKKYTSPTRLAGQGTSAGGITIGRGITERPDLFAAAISEVGASNTLRAEFGPNGPPNIPEFGTVKEPEGFKALYEMDAYQHVKDGTRNPAVLVTTGMNDPRVDPWEPAKMAARLQAATTSGKPVLLRVEYEAGHGIGSTKAQFQELLTDEYAFLFWQLGVPEFQPAASSSGAGSVKRHSLHDLTRECGGGGSASAGFVP
jgi:prolyl oligopeptidase